MRSLSNSLFEMLSIYLHRVNSISRILALPSSCSGFECDLRYISGHPYLEHDINHHLPSPDNLLSGPLPSLRVQSCILNVKETGFEELTLSYLSSYFKSVLLLDVPFPIVPRLHKLGLSSSIMWRLSEHEKPSIDQLLSFNCRWIWLDSFSNYWFRESDIVPLKAAGFNICLVSNELQGRNIKDNFELISSLSRLSLIDAVCTKYPSFYL